MHPGSGPHLPVPTGPGTTETVLLSLSTTGPLPRAHRDPSDVLPEDAVGDLDRRFSDGVVHGVQVDPDLGSNTLPSVPPALPGGTSPAICVWSVLPGRARAADDGTLPGAKTLPETDARTSL